MKKLLLLCVVMLAAVGPYLLSSCSTVKLNPDTNAIIQGAGYTAAFLFAQNNPDKIGEIEQAVTRASAMANSPTLNLATLLQDIKWYAADLQVQNPRDARVIYPVLYQVGLLMDADLALPGNQTKALAQLKVLLKGVQEGIRDAKGVSK